MKIVQMVRALELGGLERIAVDLAMAQKAAGHWPLIYTLMDAGPLAEEARAAGIEVWSFHKQRGFSLQTLWRIVQRLRKDRPDVLHAHNEVVHHYAAAAGRLAGVPAVVSTIHGGDKSVRDLRQERHYRTALRWTDAVVMVSASTLALYVAQMGVPAKMCRVIRAGISVEKFASRPATPGEHWPRVRFGTVGRLVPAKDHRNLLEAFARVVERVPAAELSVLGDGILREALQQRAAELGIASRVDFVRGDADVPNFLSGLDVFVLSSMTEGLPLVVLEAMSAGLPLVATTVDGVPEVASDDRAAVLCEPRRPEDLAEAMASLAEQSRLREMGRAAQLIAQKQFGIRQSWAQYEQMFQELLRQPGRSYLSRLAGWN